MKNYIRSIITVTASIIIDFSIRILLKNNHKSVLQFEAILFFIVAVLFFYFINWKKIPVRKIHRLEIVLCYFYLLGSLRAILIILAVTVNLANILLFILTIVIACYHLIIRKALNENKKTIQS